MSEHSSGAAGASTAHPRSSKLLLALCAFLFVALVAVGSALVTVLLLDRDADVTGGTSQAANDPGTVATPSPSGEEAVVPSAEPTPSTEVLEVDPDAPLEAVDPEATFTSTYSGQRLRVTDTCFGRRVDLDEPRVGVDGPTYDLVYEYCSETPELQFPSNVSVSLGGSEGAGPGDCAEAIRVGVDPNRFAPAEGQHICVITDAEAARELGVTHKVVLLEVLDVGPDGTLGLDASAWDIPA